MAEQIEEIKSATYEAVNTIKDAAWSIREAVREEARSGIKVIADAASEALKVTNIKNSNDHDLLIKISTQMERLNSDVNEIKSGTSGKIDEHEKRLKCIETTLAENNGGKNEKKYTVEWVFAALMFLATVANIFFSSVNK